MGEKSGGSDSEFGSSGYDIVSRTVSVGSPSGWDKIGVDAITVTETGYVLPKISGDIFDGKLGPIDVTLTKIDGGFAFGASAFGKGSFISLARNASGVIVLDDGWINDLYRNVIKRKPSDIISWRIRRFW